MGQKLYSLQLFRTMIKNPTDVALENVRGYTGFQNVYRKTLKDPCPKQEIGIPIYF